MHAKACLEWFLPNLEKYSKQLKPMNAQTPRRSVKRDTVMRCAMEAIARDGAGGVRLEDVATRAEMSVGHVMYYFGTRDRLLLETLCWSELAAHGELTSELARLRSPKRRAARYVEHYLPRQPRDPRWSMWFQLSCASNEPVRGVEELESAGNAWRDLFIGIVEDGVTSGAFRAVDPGDLAEWYLPYLDGLALEIVTAGSHAQVGTRVSRALRRLEKMLNQRIPPR
jgi:AcrR family transcriptional regulator